MKTITIDDKKYKIECNALTYIQHRKVFNKGIFSDIQILKDYLIMQILTTARLKKENPKITEQELTEKLSEITTTKLDDFVEAATRIAYTLIFCANEDIEDYETFLKGIKSLKIDDEWIVEVTEFAVDCFC
jgi:hypothetical protein